MRSVLDHLSICEICRRRIEREAAGDVEYLELREELAGGIESPIQSAARVHLSFDEIAGFVDGTLTGEELQVLEDHLSCCEECGLAVNDIEAFKTQLAPGQDYEYRPSSLPGDPVESKWRRLSSPFLEWKSLASALAALLLAVGVWLVWREWQAGGTKPAITNVIPSGSPAATPNPSPESSLVVMLNDGAGRVM
ncbi:MAG: zf-HC2 domain-containing protein, partial [Blastocatellia bacterium]|nr:zf-HC2 domain-containing protein [Blastocatellia bacterium]